MKTDRFLAPSGLAGAPAVLLDGGIPRGATKRLDLHPADACRVESGVGWPPWQSRPRAQLPLILLMFSFCLSDASLLNYLPREFGLLHLWFGKGFTRIFALVVS